MPRRDPPAEGLEIPIAVFLGIPITGTVRKVLFYADDVRAWNVRLGYPTGVRTREPDRMALGISPGFDPQVASGEFFVRQRADGAWRVMDPQPILGADGTYTIPA